MIVFFFILAAIAIFAAIMVVTRKSAVNSAVYLVLTMCSLAGLFVLLGAYFLAAFQIIVYAGAIMVLFLFVIMLLNLRKDEFGSDPGLLRKYLGFALAAIILVQSAFIVAWALNANPMQDTYSQTTVESGGADTTAVENYQSAESVAETLFTHFAYPFEITSVLLLAAILGAVVIARRKGVTETEPEE